LGGVTNVTDHAGNLKGRGIWRETLKAPPHPSRGMHIEVQQQEAADDWPCKRSMEDMEGNDKRQRPFSILFKKNLNLDLF